jgi:P-type E1-E2 ATPase
VYFQTRKPRRSNAPSSHSQSHKDHPCSACRPSSAKKKKTKRATIVTVGDCINDAPALSTDDSCIAIGSGSDIALSFPSLILINSNLTTVLTLLDLSRIVFRRVYFNFEWTIVYNLVTMPIAAEVLYQITTDKEMD